MAKKSDYFKPLRKSAIGLAGLSVSTAIGAGVAAKAPAGTPSLTGGFSTLASFTPVTITAISSKNVLRILKKK